jgi:hypothetical protein
MRHSGLKDEVVRGVQTMRKHRGLFAVLCAGTLLLGALACEDSEKVPPDESTISLSANPAQVIIVSGVQLTPVTLIATVRNAIGVPLPDQDVRFTTTNGVLNPAPATPVRTDKIGNAYSTLTGAAQGPNVTATAGKATVSLTLTAGTSAICFLTLTPSTPQTISDCSDSFDFTVLAEDCSNKPVENVRIFLEFVPNGNADALTGNFDPDTGVTATDGTVTTTLSFLDNVCADKCTDPKDCRSLIRAKDAAGFIFSNAVDILDGIQ